MKLWAAVGPLLLALVATWLVLVHAAGETASRRDSASFDAVAPTASPTATTVGTAPVSATTDPARTQIQQVDAAWVSNVAGRTGIPARALTGYADAQLTVAASHPRCHLVWTMLAGIGLVESGHGSHGGAKLRADGTTSIRILGPALDGTDGNIAIPATSEGLRLDGDPRWDHAVGPMQFVPSTWMRWGISADGGVPDPNDIDDAALTAADYLCAAGGDLATAAGWRAAVAAYNAPVAYAVAVTDAANMYGRES